jgi:hypothetical protein
MAKIKAAKQIKKHLKRLHKIKIHHNRWLIWAIAFSVIVFSCLLAYISTSQRAFEQNMADFSYLNHNGVVYRDVKHGFSLKHPYNWGVEVPQPDLVVFSDPFNYGQSLEVEIYKPADRAALKKAADVASQQTLTVDGVTGEQWNLGSDSEMETMILLENNGMLYVIRSNTPWLTHILATWHFAEPSN